MERSVANYVQELVWKPLNLLVSRIIWRHQQWSLRQEKESKSNISSPISMYDWMNFGRQVFKCCSAYLASSGFAEWRSEYAIATSFICDKLSVRATELRKFGDNFSVCNKIDILV